MPTQHPARMWQDTLLTISQQLPLQRDVHSLVRVLASTCQQIFDFHRVILFLAAPQHEQAVLHCLDRQSGKLSVTEHCFVPTPEQARIWACPEVFWHDNVHFLRDYPQLAELEPYHHMQACLHVPLQAQGEQYGTLHFVKTEGLSFPNEVVVFCRVLAGIVAANLAAILKVQTVQREMDSVRRERDYFSILVDVTNTAIGTLEMDAMVCTVARELRKFFGIHSLALLLLDNVEEARSFAIRAAMEDEGFSSGPHAYAGSRLQQALAEKRPLALRPQETPADPAAVFLQKQGSTAAYLFPLHLGSRLLGAMLLGHTHEDIFTTSSIELLEQIAARVGIAVHNALDYSAVTVQKESLVQENLYLSKQMEDNITFGDIVGKSSAIRRTLEQVDMVANSDSSVLLLGETGTGKELLALAIHNRSKRHDRRMIKMNCAAMPAGLLESELFGHERGAFTGAATQRKGRFELAHGSTLMLDEVGDIPLELQPKLLRVLQAREIERIGGSRVIPVDVRLVAATNRNLQEMVLNATFRDDLYYRLNVFPIAVPPLRDRREDIPLLAQHYTQALARRMKKNITHIPAEAMRRLCHHDWPGNVRELANVIERAVILSPGPSLDLYPLEVPQLRAATVRQERETEVSLTLAIPEMVHPQIGEDASERERIMAALVECNGVVAGPRGVAARLGLKRTTLLSRMQRMGITVRDALGGKGE